MNGFYVGGKTLPEDYMEKAERYKEKNMKRDYLGEVSKTKSYYVTCEGEYYTINFEKMSSVELEEYNRFVSKYIGYHGMFKGEPFTIDQEGHYQYGYARRREPKYFKNEDAKMVEELLDTVGYFKGDDSVKHPPKVEGVINYGQYKDSHISGGFLEKVSDMGKASINIDNGIAEINDVVAAPLAERESFVEALKSLEDLPLVVSNGLGTIKKNYGGEES